jgi:hypothetical protein
MRGGGKGGNAVGDMETVVRWVRELAMDPVVVAEVAAITPSRHGARRPWMTRRRLLPHALTSRRTRWVLRCGSRRACAITGGGS